MKLFLMHLIIIVIGFLKYSLKIYLTIINLYGNFEFILFTSKQYFFLI